MDFVHLHVHSQYSIEDGVPNVRELVRYARDLGMSSLALTDHNTLGGIIPFCDACAEFGVRPITGCELNIASFRLKPSLTELYKILFLVETEPGYRNLVSLVNRAHANAKKGVPFLRFSDLRDQTAGLVVLTGGGATELFKLLELGRLDDTEEHVKELARAMGRDNLVFEIQDHDLPKQKQINERVYQLSDFLSMRCVATNDAHFLRADDAICHSFLRHEPPREFLQSYRHIHGTYTRHLATEEEMREKFTLYPRALYATAEVAERCSFRPNFDKKRYPVHDFVRGFDADSFLWDLTFREARGRFAELGQEMKDRLNQEFDFIKTERLSNNILLLWNVAQFCRKNRISIGVGRGNMISSFVAYILGITQINPLDYKLRFLGFGDAACSTRRLSIEVPMKHRHALQDFLKETFGADFCSIVGEYEWCQPTPMAREICGWLDVPRSKMEDVLTQMDRVTALAGLRPGDAGERSDPESVADPALVKYMLGRLIPRPRALTSSDNQFAISGENLDHVTPRIEAGGVHVTQMDADSIDLLNVPRLILESNPTLNVLDTAAAWVRKEENAAFDPDRIPLDDSDTYELLSRGLTNGVDPFHSITLKSLLRANRPRNFIGLMKIKSMERTPDKEQDADVREHVPECLLTYRCAFIKAHYPVSFMAAMLTHAYHNRKTFTVILREAKQMGLRILPPSINLSIYEFSQEHKTIRTGLMVVSGVTEKVYAELARVRKGGDFHDLPDLCRRTDSELVADSVLSNLVKTGALDCFGLKRSQMLRMIEEEADHWRKSPAGAPFIHIAPKIQEMPVPDIIKYEIAAAGYCISVDQLHLYKDLMKQCRALSPYELSAKLVGREVYVAGFLEHVEYDSPLVDDSDQVLLDLEGRVVTMPIKASRLYEQALRASAPVLVGGTVHRRKEEVYVKALTAFTLRTVQQMSRQVNRLDLDLSGEDHRTLRLIRSLVRHYRGKDTQVRIQNFHGSALSRWLIGPIEKTRVFFSPPFYYALKKILPEDRIGLDVSDEMNPELLHTLSPQRFPRPGGRIEDVPEQEANSSVVDVY